MTGGRTCADAVIRHATLLLPEHPDGYLADGAIAVDGGVIVALGSTTDIDARFEAARAFDADGGIAHAGFVEPHLHISQHVSRGINGALRNAGRTDLGYAHWKAAVRPEEERASVALACLDLLRAGYTSFVDPGTIFDTAAAAEAIRESGLRAWLAAPYVWDRAGGDIGGLVGAELLERVPANLERCAALLADDPPGCDPAARINAHIGLYGEVTASDTLWRLAREAADARGQTLSAHLEFDPRLTRAFRSEHGRSPVAHLDGLGVLGPNVSLTHLNSLEDDDIERLFARGCRAVWCPANAMNAEASGGRNRLLEFAARGGTVGIGMDVPQIHPIGEIGTVARLARGGHAVLSSRDLFRMMTEGAAASILAPTAALSAQPGRLATGACADIVIRSPDAPETIPGVDLYDEITCFGRPGGVRTVLVDGETLLDDGALTRVDAEAVFGAASRAGRDVMRRIGFAVPAGRHR